MDLTGWASVAMWRGGRCRRDDNRDVPAAPPCAAAHLLAELLVGGLAMTAAFHHSDPSSIWITATFAAVMSVVIAFFRSPYLKIGGGAPFSRPPSVTANPIRRPTDGQPAVPPHPLP